MNLSPLKWDSNFFGIRMGSMEPPAMGTTSRRSFQNAVTNSGLQWIQCCMPHDHKKEETEMLLQQLGFDFVDLRIELRGGVESHFEPSPNLKVRRMVLEDLEKMGSMQSIFTEDSRYNFRGIIPSVMIDKFYRTWVENSDAGLHDDACYVAEAGPYILGFVTVKKLKDGVMRMGLMGIEPRAQGHGVGSTLTHFCKGLAKEQGCHTIEAITEGRNVMTQKFHKKNGLQEFLTKSWYYYLAPELFDGR